MQLDLNAADAARGLAVLLHPHPDFGGNRFHPFVDGLYRRLPDIGINAVRFDFSSGDLSAAHREALAAIDDGAARWPQVPVLLVGYSFGAGIASGIDDERIAAWYLLAPPSVMLEDATIGDDPRPKAVVIPENDQFTPPASVAQLLSGWEETTVTTLPDTDHFLGNVRPIVDDALQWIAGVAGV